MYPKELQQLIESFKMYPGVGSKTAERYALVVLEQPLEVVEQFSNALIEAKTKIKPCENCGHYSNASLCDICKDPSRNDSIIFVVATSKDVIAIEKINSFTGRYHVLGGLISTHQGIMPNDLNIENLIKRVDENVTELIMAFSPTIEGETTALYLSKRLENRVKITKLAQGLPMGGQLEYADETTLIRSIENRLKV